MSTSTTSQDGASIALEAGEESIGAIRDAKLNQGHPTIVDNSEPHFYIDPSESAPDTRPIAERLDSLFEGMPGRRDVLLAILRECTEPRTDEHVLQVVESQQASNRSVFEAHTLCRLLEQAGGLAHVLEDGSPFREEDYEPVVIVEDGQEYLQAAVPPVSCWLSTDEGLAYADADDPSGRTRSVLADEEQYLPIYKYLLAACKGEGSKTPVLADVIDSHPLVQEPRLYVQHFVKLLEDAGALVWKDAWQTTQAGEEILSELEDVEAIA